MSRSVFIFGASGRMGQEIKNIVENTEGLTYAGGHSRSQPNLSPPRKPDVVIDFTLPESLPQVMDFVSEQKCALVSGITGYTPDQFVNLKSLGQSVPVFWSANMSFGVFLMCQLTELLAKFNDFYDFHVEETHHVHKKDKPSGTALIIERAAKKSTKDLGETVSHREGEVFGIHRFIASSRNEELEIRHQAHNRALFAQGAVDIAQWVVQQNAGFYEMDDFFKNYQN